MPETEADIDSLLDDVPLEGEEAPKPAKADKPETKGELGEAEKTDKPDSPDKRAEDIDKRLKKVLQKALPNPDAACLMVDIFGPGEAIIALKGDFNLSPKMHLLLAAVVIFGVALASNPEVMAKLRNGFKRSKKNAAAPPPTPAKQFAPQTNGADKSARAIIDNVQLEDDAEATA